MKNREWLQSMALYDLLCKISDYGECNDCGFIAANYDEARFTLLGAIRLWNKKCKLSKERDSN